MKQHRKNDTYIVTDSCYWHDHAKDEKGRACHEVELCNERTGAMKCIKSGSRIKIISQP